MKSDTESDARYKRIGDNFGGTYKVFHLSDFIGHVQKRGDYWVATPDKLTATGPAAWGSFMIEAKRVRTMFRSRHEAFLWLLGIKDAERYSQ